MASMQLIEKLLSSPFKMSFSSWNIVQSCGNTFVIICSRRTETDPLYANRSYDLFLALLRQIVGRCVSQSNRPLAQGMRHKQEYLTSNLRAGYCPIPRSAQAFNKREANALCLQQPPSKEITRGEERGSLPTFRLLLFLQQQRWIGEG